MRKSNKENNMKKATKLVVKKVTLRDLDDPTLDSIAGGITGDTCEPTLKCKPTWKCKWTEGGDLTGCAC